jgi:predicted O-methyltransferase YrrM
MIEAPVPRGSLRDPQVRSVLETLHRRARQDWRVILRKLPLFWSLLRGSRNYPPAELASLLKDAYLPLSREQGTFLYLVARAIGAKRIVEFGSSYGISTIYAAAAARDNGGFVIGTELEPSKQRAATENLKAAGLSDFAEIRLGDALETLRDVDSPVDLLLLDGWKELYLPVLQLMEPKLRAGSVVLADNIRTFRKALAPYVQYVQSGAHGFLSVTLPLKDGFEYSVRLAPCS